MDNVEIQSTPEVTNLPEQCEGEKFGNNITERDLNYYLDSFLDRSNLPPPFNLCRESSELVKKFVVKFSLSLTQHSRNFSQVFQPLHEENDEGLQRCIRPQNNNIFIVRLFLKRPTSQGLFEVLVGKKKNIPPGQALIRISSELTNEDRMIARREWLPSLDQQNHLSLLQIHSWLDAEVEKILRKIKAENKEMKGLKVEKTPQSSLKIIMEPSEDDLSTAMEGATQSGNPSTPVVLILRPTVEGKGWPTDVPLKHPLPPSPPWSILGSMWIVDAKSAIMREDVLWFMEEGNKALSTVSSKWPAWDIFFVPLENFWEKRLFESDLKVQLSSALSVLELIKANSPLHWDVLEPDVMRHIVFNWVKNSADTNETLADWVLTLLESIREIITPEGVCTFFIPSCSLVTQNQLPDLLKLKAGVAKLITDFSSDPSNILKYIVKTDIP